MSGSMFGLRKSAVQSLVGPALTPEEMTTNLSVLEKSLNRSMKCPAGRNQVYIRSLIVLGGATKPRVVLKCHLRKDIGQQGEVFYEHIRDVCCSDPGQCEAWRKLKDRFVET